MTLEMIIFYISQNNRVWRDTAIPFKEVICEFETWLASHNLWSEKDRGTLNQAAFVTWFVCLHLISQILSHFLLKKKKFIYISTLFLRYFLAEIGT